MKKIIITTAAIVLLLVAGWVIYTYQDDSVQTGPKDPVPTNVAPDGKLSSDPAQWEQSSIGDLVIPGPMALLGEEKVINNEVVKVTSNSFNAGEGDVAALSDYVSTNNTQYQWEITDVENGQRMLGKKTETNYVIVDIINLPQAPDTLMSVVQTEENKN